MEYEIAVTGKDGASQRFRVKLGAAEAPSATAEDKFEALTCSVNGEEIGPDLNGVLLEDGTLSLLIGGRSYTIGRDRAGEQIEIQVGPHRYTVEISDPRSLRSRRGRGASSDGPRKITAPMPGKVVRILVPVGTEVEAGQGIIVIEAMKMQNELKSPKKGMVKRIMAVEGARVNPGDALAIVE